MSEGLENLRCFLEKGMNGKNGRVNLISLSGKVYGMIFWTITLRKSLNNTEKTKGVV
jgi:hypothetical protein